MGYITKTTKELFDGLIPGDVKGIANPGEWKNARPVTLRGILKGVMDQYPDIMWLVEENEDTGKAGDDAPACMISQVVLHLPEDTETAEADEAPTPDKNEVRGESCGADQREETCEEPEFEEKEATESEAEPAAVEPVPEPEAVGGATDLSASDSGPELTAVAAVEPESEEEDDRPEPAADTASESRLTSEQLSERAKRYEYWMREKGSKALTTEESKETAYAMLDEGFTLTQIGLVIRRSAQTVNNWKKKREAEAAGVKP